MKTVLLKEDSACGNLDEIAIQLKSSIEDEKTIIPPHKQTPITESGAVISSLWDIWEMWSFEDKSNFIDSIFSPLWEDENTSGENQIDEIKKLEDMTEWNGEPFVPGFKPAIVQIGIAMTACAFAIQAFKAEKNTSEAWSYTCEAKRWLGILQGTISGRGMEKGVEITKFSLAGLDVRHSENRKMKAEVFAWCDVNMPNYKSMDSAAEAIAGKVVPVTFRTARGWIADWKKKQSTGTA